MIQLEQFNDICRLKVPNFDAQQWESKLEKNYGTSKAEWTDEGLVWDESKVQTSTKSKLSAEAMLKRIHLSDENLWADEVLNTYWGSANRMIAEINYRFEGNVLVLSQVSIRAVETRINAGIHPEVARLLSTRETYFEPIMEEVELVEEGGLVAELSIAYDDAHFELNNISTLNGQSVYTNPNKPSGFNSVIKIEAHGAQYIEEQLIDMAGFTKGIPADGFSLSWDRSVKVDWYVPSAITELAVELRVGDSLHGEFEYAWCVLKKDGTHEFLTSKP